MNGAVFDKPYDLAELFTVLRRHYKGASAPATMSQLPSRRQHPGRAGGHPGLDPDCAINDTGISPTLPAPPRQVSRPVCRWPPGPARRCGCPGLGARWCPSPTPSRAAPASLGMSEIAAIAGRLEAAARAGDAARAQRALQALEAWAAAYRRGAGQVLPRRGEARRCQAVQASNLLT